MKRIFRLLSCLLLLPGPLWAWGVVGHRTIGQIADNHLSRKAHQAVAQLLGHETLALVSTFPDEIRGYPEFTYTAPWHYVNTAVGLSPDQYVAELKGMTKPNVYSALLAQLAVLKDPAAAKDQKVFALKFVVHLVGDAHQPLHTGTAETHGGNDIKVTFRGKETNLHSLWDSGLVDYPGFSFLEWVQTLDHADATQVRQWQQAAPATWLFESYQLSQPLAAEAMQHPDCDYRYYPRYSPMLEQRLLQAGIRLAGVLNAAFE